ncbi:MAG TPA: endonuclease/exonuclease/phosphatase family protein [Patescibacteria group bacterium]
MKILSYNILAGGFKDYGSHADKPEKLDLMVKIISSVRADLVSLVDTFRWSEVFGEDELKRLFGYKKVIMYPLNRTMEDVKCKSEIAVMTNLEAKFEPIALVDRNAIKIPIINGKEETDFFTVYLNPKNEKKRIEEVEELMKYTDINKATIIGGDLNAIKKGEFKGWERLAVRVAGILPNYRAHLKTVTDMEKAQTIALLEKYGWIDSDLQHQATIPSKIVAAGLVKPFLRLDYFFHSPQIKVKRFEVLKGKDYDKLSDHYPILMEV